MKWVLLPGFDGTGKLFAPFLRVLPLDIEPVVVSYPTNRCCKVGELVEIVRASFPINEPYVIVAESFSGPIALRAAAQHGDLPMATVLCASFIKCPFRPILFRVIEPWAGLLTRLRPPRSLVRCYLLGHANAEMFELFYRAIGDVSPNVLANRLKVFRSFDGDFVPRQWTTPLLYLQAELDRLVSPDNFDVVQQRYPQVRLEKISSPHLLFQTQPEAALRAISAFLSKQ